MRLSELCIRRPVMTTLLMASLLLAGFFGYRQLPIAAIPRIEVPTITVTVQYPGASPDTMAVSVAAPLERQFATIAGITSITSLSTEGNTQITLEFDLNRNIDAAALDVQSAISVAAARLPEDLPTPPAYRKVNPADTPGHLPGADLRHGAVAGDQRVRRQGDEPAALDAAGRRAGQHPGRAEAGRAHQVRPRRAGHARHLGRGDPPGRDGAGLGQPDRQHPHRSSSSTSSRPRAPSRPRPTSSRWSSPGATARRCGCRTSPRSRTRSRTTRRAPSSTACARSSSRCSASRTPTRSR